MSFARLKYYYLSLEGKVKMIQDPFPPAGALEQSTGGRQ